MLDNLRVSMVQASTLWHDAQGNRALYGELIRQCPETDLIVLPETFLSGFSNNTREFAERMDGAGMQWLAQMARQKQCVITGSIAVHDGDKLLNRLVWMRPDGDFALYDKRHLFRMAGEHERYGSGTDRLVVELNGWRICPLICYDLRFPVFSRNRFAGKSADGRDYDLLLYVANWPAARAYPWKTLLRARAIENLSYCVGVNRVGVDGNGIAYQGESVALDFLGQPLVEMDADPGVSSAVLSATSLAEHRQRFPAFLDADDFVLT